jgi:hypothetical protein
VAVQADWPTVEREYLGGRRMEDTLLCQSINSAARFESGVEAYERLGPERPVCIKGLDTRPNVWGSYRGERARKTFVFIYETLIEIENVHA